MKKEDKKTMKDIIKHRELEQNIPAYANAYIDTAYEYSLIHLVLNYYMMKEIQEEGGQASKDSFLSEVVDAIHTLIYKTILSKESVEDLTDILQEIDILRNRITEKMTVLTAYTDALQIYEYVLNRVEYGITGKEYPVEESELAARVFQYLFRDNDKMVVNSKIQMVTGQLPIRMTKNRFFDYLSSTLNIYNGSEQSAVDDFVHMLKSTALLELPQGYETDYPEIYDVLKHLEASDLKTMELEQYQKQTDEFHETADYLNAMVSNYLIAAEIINDLYAALLAYPHQNNEGTGATTCISMLRGLHDSYISGGSIPEEVDNGFLDIEGLQEELGEDMMQFEGLLPDVLSGYKEQIEATGTENMFNGLDRISKLLSNSLFIDLSEKKEENEIADSLYIGEKLKELTTLLTDFFNKNKKEVNRAVMAALFSNMPVLFNSQQEIKEYIEYSLNHCSNQSELMACAKILDEMMEEE